MASDSSKVSTIGALIIVVSLSLLALVPYVFTKKHFLFEGPENVSPPQKYDISKKLPVVYPPEESRKLGQASLESLMQGNQTILLNFWATWCPPCIEELPTLEMLNRQWESLRKKESETQKPPLIVLISTDENAKAIGELFKTLDFSPNFLILHDPLGVYARDVFGTEKYPETFWLKQEGELLFKWVGPQDWLSASVIKRFGQLDKS